MSLSVNEYADLMEDFVNENNDYNRLVEFAEERGHSRKDLDDVSEALAEALS